MCGIFGVVGRRDHAGLREAALTLRHRGPDGFGEWSSVDGTAYLAHLRLAIIDLSEDASQPMPNEDGSLRLVFNGEIYNFRELRAQLQAAGHRFRSRSDSEVIVHGYAEWGDAIVEHLRGIFAFALWDDHRRRLLLARDRLGVKPLVYRLFGSELMFASDTRALVAASGGQSEVNPDAMYQFLRQSYISGSHTIWKGIDRLPPGCTLAFDANRGTTQVRQYWQLDPVVSRTEGRGMDDAAASLESLMGAAVREELVADVPVGVFLSGGIDSSLVSSFAVEAAPRIDSFFIDFTGWQDSERPDADAVASLLGTAHHVAEVSPQALRLDDPERARELFSAFDEPIGDPAIVPTWHLSRHMRERVTVALSGDGGDELFGGYTWYAQVAPTQRRRLAWRLERLRRAAGVGREWPRGCADQHEYYHFLHAPSFGRSELELLFPDALRGAQPMRPGIGPAAVSPRRGLKTQREWQELDVQTYLVDNNLARMDRASMAHGLEVRVPMLDHRVVEFAFGLSPELLSAGNGGKPILRRLASRRLPESLQGKRKRGFSFPLARVVSDAHMTAALRGGRLVEAGLLDGAGLEAWLAEDPPGLHSFKLWLLFVLENWARCWLPMAKVAA